MCDDNNINGNYSTILDNSRNRPLARLGEGEEKGATVLVQVNIPQSFNYIGVFLTFDCDMRCPYCINRSGVLVPRETMSSQDWVKGLNRIVTRPDLPITLQGGEPTAHPTFYDIVYGIREDINIDLLTNLDFDIDEFMNHVPADRMKRKAPYASIRVSYHPLCTNSVDLVMRVGRMLKRGYSIGIWAVDHPAYGEHIKKCRLMAEAMGIDFRTKEFLGVWKGELYGTYRYDKSVSSPIPRECRCRGSELLIGPAGKIFRCHRDLYSDSNAIGHILDREAPALGIWKPCREFGGCNFCDVKLKTNRFQQFGHSSVEIKDIKEIR